MTSSPPGHPLSGILAALEPVRLPLQILFAVGALALLPTYVRVGLFVAAVPQILQLWQSPGLLLAYAPFVLVGLLVVRAVLRRGRRGPDRRATLSWVVGRVMALAILLVAPFVLLFEGIALASRISGSMVVGLLWLALLIHLVRVTVIIAAVALAWAVGRSIAPRGPGRGPT